MRDLILLIQHWRSKSKKLSRLQILTFVTLLIWTIIFIAMAFDPNH